MPGGWPVHLYRGDRSDFAKAWRTDGIMSRLMMGGKPATIELVGFWEAARGHARRDGPGERVLSDHPASVILGVHRTSRTVCVGTNREGPP